MNKTTASSPPSIAPLLKFTHPWPLSLPADPQPGTGKGLPPKTRILVAEDDAVSRELICTRLALWGYEVIVTENGTQAMSALRQTDAPALAILDWMMPGMDGVEICQRIRAGGWGLYIILLTSRGSKHDLVEGLGAGADDYLIKPFDKDELRARILVGLRIMELQTALADRVAELESANGEIRGLKLRLMM